MVDLTAIYCVLYVQSVLNAFYVYSNTIYTTVQLFKMCTDMHATLSSAYNEKNVQRFCFIIGWLLIKGSVIIGEWGVFGVEIFLCYS